MVFREKLKTILQAFPEAREVRVDERALVATLVSSSFAGVDEAERQEQVWRHLRENLSADELRSVEFVLTDAPGEDTREDQPAIQP